jgi:hypothetical protein
MNVECQEDLIDRLRVAIKESEGEGPTSNHLLATLTMELGELSEMLLKGDNPNEQDQAVKVAALALRIAAEGDEAFKQEKRDDK